MDSRIPRPRHIVIIGGGVIGTTTAYFLTRHPSFNTSIHHITLLEATSIAAAASGKAGGLLGLWAYPMCIVPLSYRLHKELAAEHDGAMRWGYRRVECGQLTATVTHEHLKEHAAEIGSDCMPFVAERLKQSREEQLASWGNLGLKTSDNSVDFADLPPPPTPEPLTPPPHEYEPAINGKGESFPVPLIAEGREEHGTEQTEWKKLPKQDEAAAALLHESKLPSDLDWIESDLVNEYAEMGLPGYTETAQVHPYLFTTAMADLARRGGTEIRIGAKVTNIRLDPSSSAVKSLEYVDRYSENDEVHTILGVTDVVVAAGPWTGRLLPKTKVEGLRAHSVVFEADVSPHAVFTDISLPDDWVPTHRVAKGEKRRKHKGNVDPEVYARPGREVYACGEPDPRIALPETADLVQCDEAQCDDLVAYLGTVSRVLANAPVVAKQACYMPRHERAGREDSPLVGATSVKGLWVAAGHTCWGIQNGPGTGKLMSELIMEGTATSADIADLDPRKFKI